MVCEPCLEKSLSYQEGWGEIERPPGQQRDQGPTR